MPRVIILNGPAGVGKTTVGVLLAQQFENSACISGDALREFIVRKTAVVKGRLGYKNGACLIRNFIGAGYETVVFEYVFPGKSQVDYFFAALDVEVPVCFYTLWASLETVRAREAARTGRAPLGERVMQCYEELAANLHELGLVIQTDHLTPAAVVAAILNRNA